MKLNNNDDSHNSGLNLLIYNMLLDIESHPAWVCGLKHSQSKLNFNCTVSHPAWVCGLKPLYGPKLYRQFIVTPCVGVWIETYHQGDDDTFPESHPAWVCGLKHVKRFNSLSNSESHPAWVCGLKHGLIRPSTSGSKSHTLRGCVD